MAGAGIIAKEMDLGVILHGSATPAVLKDESSLSARVVVPPSQLNGYAYLPLF